nr:antigen LPMC-61-like [Lytechinus pictus]
MKTTILLGSFVLCVLHLEGQCAPAGRKLLQWQPQWRQGYNQWNQQWYQQQPQAQRQQTQWMLDPEERFEQQEEVLENQQELREDAFENQRGPLRQTANGQLVYNSQSREVVVGAAGNAPAPYIAPGGSTFSSEDYGSYVLSTIQPNAYYRNGYQPWNPNQWD